jgi:hypothetical protein
VVSCLSGLIRLEAGLSVLFYQRQNRAIFELKSEVLRAVWLSRLGCRTRANRRSDGFFGVVFRVSAERVSHLREVTVARWVAISRGLRDERVWRKVLECGICF